MLGAGLLALSGSNTYTGGTFLDSGTLNFTATALPTGPGSITFNGGILQWAAGNTLDVSAGIAPIAASQLAKIDSNGNNVTFASPLSGQGGLTKYGAGILTLTASNSYTGGTTVDVGTLLAANTAALPGYTAPRSVVVNPGATLAVTAGTNAGEFSLTPGGGVDTVLTTGNVYFAASANLGINVNSPENVIYGTSIANTVNGPLGFVKLGTGILSLTGNNTYTNGTQVNGGVLIATSVNTLGSFAGQPAYLAGGQISVNGAGSTLVVQAGTSAGEFQSSDVTSVLSNVAFGTGTVFGIQVVSGETFPYSSSIPDGSSGSAGMGFYKLGAGTLTLAAQNNYSGTTTISAGVLVAAAAGSLGNGTAVQVGDIYTGSTATQLLISGANTFPQNITVNALNATLGNIDDNNAGFGGNITLNSSLTIASASVNNALTFSGNIVHGSGTNSVTLTGPGNVVFLGNATYAGATTINGGNLTVGATGSLPSTTTLNINNGLSTVTLSNTAQTLAGLNGVPGSTLLLAYGQGATLTVGSGSFAGSINDDTNEANLVKTTTGILYLTGANTYYGSTTVTAGALLYGSLSDVSTVGYPITVSSSGAVGLYLASGLPGLLPNLSSGTGSTGTLVVTPATSADAVNLTTNSLSYLSLGALDNETYTGVLTPSGTNYRLGGGGGTLTYPSALTGSRAWWPTARRPAARSS